MATASELVAVPVQLSDDDIVREIGTVLNSVDLSTTTMSGIREQLERNLGLELSDKKAFIREQVDLYLEQHANLGPLVKAEEEGGEENGEHQEQQPVQSSVEEALPNDQELEQFRENIELAIEDSQMNEGLTKHCEMELKLEAAPPAQIKPQSPTLPSGAATSTPKEKKKRGGLNKVCRLSPELQAIIGEESLPRTQVVKQLWVYIRAHNLQDPENKRNIICDDALRELFGTDSTDMFQMNKLLSKHIWSITEEGFEDSEPKSKRQKAEKKDTTGKGKASGFLVPSPISDALQKFLGTGESEVPRGEVVRRLWEYIRSNQLQDPTDKRKILCDNKLQELFECDSFVGFSMTKLLASHFVKT